MDAPAQAEQAGKADDAMAALGITDPGTRLGHVKEHIERLQPAAGALKRVLEQAPIQRISDLLVSSDSEAERWRNSTKRCEAVIMVLLAFAVAISAAVITYAASGPSEALARYAAALAINFALVGCLLVAWHMFRKQPRERWKEHRGESEYLRAKWFETVLDHPPQGNPQPGEICLLRMKTAYFRAYQLDVQQRYYQGKIGRHSFAASLPGVFIVLCMAVVCLGIGFMLLLFASVARESSIQVLPAWLPYAAEIDQGMAQLQTLETRHYDQHWLMLTLLLSVVYGIVYMWSLLNSSQQNARRFKHAHANLSHLSTQSLPTVTKLLATNATDHEKLDAMRVFVARVHAAMGNENSAWMDIGATEKMVQDGAPFVVEKFGWFFPRYKISSRIRLTPEDFDGIAGSIGIAPSRARKIGFVTAVQLAHDDVVITRWNSEVAKREAKAGDWVVTNLDANKVAITDGRGNLNRYSMSQSEFARLYVATRQAPDGAPVYAPKTVVDVLPCFGGLEIMAPWGMVQKIGKAYLMRNGDQVYGNDYKSFVATYEILGPAPASPAVGAVTTGNDGH